MSAGAVSSDPRFPIGKFRRVETLSAAERDQLIEDIAEAPRASSGGGFRTFGGTDGYSLSRWRVDGATGDSSCSRTVI